MPGSEVVYNNVQLRGAAMPINQVVVSDVQFMFGIEVFVNALRSVFKYEDHRLQFQCSFLSINRQRKDLAVWA